MKIKDREIEIFIALTSIGFYIVLLIYGVISLYEFIQRQFEKSSWKRRMKKAARNGNLLLAVKEIKEGLGISVREARNLWDWKYKKKYYKAPKYN